MNKVDLEGVRVIVLCSTLPIVYEVRNSNVAGCWELVPHITDELRKKYAKVTGIRGCLMEKKDTEYFTSVAPLWLQVGDVVGWHVRKDYKIQEIFSGIRRGKIDTRVKVLAGDEEFTISFHQFNDAKIKSCGIR